MRIENFNDEGKNVVLLFRKNLLAIAIISWLLPLGCSQPIDDFPATGAVVDDLGTADQFLKPTAGNEVSKESDALHSDCPELHNLIQVTNGIWSGGEPQGNDAFAGLVRLGVTTVVSVDGARPDVEAARRHGLRYVHIPIGYDGIDQEAGLSLARLARETEGPIYIHCHHGRHRGPAAAAVACIASGEIDEEQALGILERAGTSRDYAGLWRDVAGYRIPDADAELPELVEVAQVDSFAAAMVKIDRAWDNLKLCRDANWAAPKDHPDLVPAQQALLVKEGLRESVRNLADRFDDKFRTRLAAAERLAENLEASLRASRKESIAPQFQALEQSCKSCHSEYRD